MSPWWSKKWVPIDEISPSLVCAVICAEDQHFMEHYGFDIDAIRKAWKSNERKNKKVIKGASTISQQTAKNVFLWPGRTWIRKGLESYFTLLIELLWGKERIMEVYLNVIEMGDGIYGAEAASQFYYNKPANKLRKGEAALIAAILPNPRIYNPLRPNAMIYRKQKRILKGMQYQRHNIFEK